MTTQKDYQLPVEITIGSSNGATEIAFNWNTTLVRPTC